MKGSLQYSSLLYSLLAALTLELQGRVECLCLARRVPPNPKASAGAGDAAAAAAAAAAGEEEGEERATASTLGITPGITPE